MSKFISLRTPITIFPYCVKMKCEIRGFCRATSAFRQGGGLDGVDYTETDHRTYGQSRVVAATIVQTAISALRSYTNGKTSITEITGENAVTEKV